jgi:hypothetical protein
MQRIELFIPYLFILNKYEFLTISYQVKILNDNFPISLLYSLITRTRITLFPLFELKTIE